MDTTTKAGHRPSEQAPALRVSDLRKSFTVGGETVHAVAGIDLEIQRGEVVAMLGPNGAGKTTALDMVLGLTDPSSGDIEVFGSAPRRAVGDGRVSAVLQTGGLLRDLSVEETVRMIASTFTEHQPVDAVLERAGLTRLASRRVSKCSGGEQQRLRFALALLPDPDLLVLDEPTTGMDVSARHDFWEAMYAEAAAGRTVLFATHYLEEANTFAERIVMMARGQIVADGSTEEIRSRASGRRVSADLEAQEDDRLRSLPEVLDVHRLGDRVTATTSDSDATARALLVDLGGRHLEISSGSLDDAFLALTGGEAGDGSPGDEPPPTTGRGNHQSDTTEESVR